MPIKDATTEEGARWHARVETACEARGIETREGIVFDEATGQISDAMAWELEHDDE